MKRELLARLEELRAAGIACALVTRFSDGCQGLVSRDQCEGDLPLDGAQRQQVLALIAADRSATIDDGLFARVYQRPPRLVIVGAVHIAQALCRLAEVVGIATVVVDPRPAFASVARFPGIQLVDSWPDRALADLALDARTAVVALSHDPKLDDPALITALKSEACYAGALGSRRTHAARLQRLRETGLDEAQLARIHAPVGLPLGGRKPAEIALAILAEVIQCLYGTEATTVTKEQR